MRLFKKKKEEFNPSDVTFATIVPSGRKPDVEIHIAGFNTGNGIFTQNKLDGTEEHISTALSSVMCSYMQEVKKSSKANAIVSASMMMHRIAEAIGREDVETAWKIAMDIPFEGDIGIKSFSLKMKPEDGERLMELLGKANDAEMPPEALEMLEELLGGKED